jgi:phosphatidylserine/phosphatidylglycerophosphate/cardiolipin synthase-like enzyme
VVRLDEWFLTAAQRGNPATRLDSRHRDGLAWSVGNEVRPLIHGLSYFAELLARVSAMEAGDLLMFTDWRGDPDERLDGADTAVADQLPDPAPCGTHAVQLLTYPYRRPGYDFAPNGERSIARGYLKALPRARSLIYLESQYLWSEEVVTVAADALRSNPDLHLIAVIPRFPDQDGRISTPPNLIGRVDALSLLYAAGGSRVAVYGLENGGGIPIYVHAKVCIVDDTWAVIGSDNFNRRSWTHDSEVSCAIIDEAPWPAAESGTGGPGTGGPGAVGTFAGRPPSMRRAGTF